MNNKSVEVAMQYKKSIKFFLMFLVVFLLSACGSSSTKSSGNSDIVNDINISFESKTKIPTLVVILNWNDYHEDDAVLWSRKIFSKQALDNSVNLWYYNSTDTNIELAPVQESSGIANDGVIMVDMKKNHPYYNFNLTSGYDELRDNELYKAITSSVVQNSVDFQALDQDNNGYLNYKELEVLFVVSGGEQAYGDSADSRSIWAHSYAFNDADAPMVDDVKLLSNISDDNKIGAYTTFGSIHGIDDADRHKATIGIISHELGHSLFQLIDLYDDGGGSGLGSYDIMSGGAWAQKTTDTYPGDTPTQFSAYSKFISGLDIHLTTLNASKNVTIRCSSNELIKLTTSKANEYFLLACRDSARTYSDKAFYYLDNAFTDNKLFATLYHVDATKTSNSNVLINSEDGTQTATHHYGVALVERDATRLMTSTAGIEAKYVDVYRSGETIPNTKTKLYDGSMTGYNIVVNHADYTNRTITFRITK